MKPKTRNTSTGGARAKKKVSGPRPPAPLTVEEVGEIFRYLEKLDGFDMEMGLEERILKEGPSKDRFGEIAELPAVKIIDIAGEIEDAYMNEREGPFPEFKKLHKAVANMVIDAVLLGDHELFQHLATLVKIGKNSWTKARFRDLGIKRTAGRKLQSYDLDVVGPLAVENCLTRRIMKIDGVLLLHRMTRDELRNEIRKLQAERGFEGQAILSEGTLSRLISRMGIGSFMDSRWCNPKGELAQPYPEVVLPTGDETPLL